MVNETGPERALVGRIVARVVTALVLRMLTQMCASQAHYVQAWILLPAPLEHEVEHHGHHVDLAPWRHAADIWMDHHPSPYVTGQLFWKARGGNHVYPTVVGIGFY